MQHWCCLAGGRIRRLVTDAERMGYNSNEYQRGPDTLVAATGVANMAANQGWTASANAIVQAIDR
jgi:hypothetical protein